MGLFRRLALNRIDFIIVAILIAAMIAAGVVFWHGFWDGTAFNKNIAAAVFSGWILILLACVGGVIKITSMRQSLIRLFVSEIKALQYGLANLDMFDFWQMVHDEPEKGAMGFADAPRQENYFQYFDGLGDNIGNLHPNVVEAIVRFYTYLKMSRDAATALRGWTPETGREVRQLHVSYVVNLLALSMTWGFVALWFMGFQASPQEREFLRKIEASYDAVFGAGSFGKLRERHVRRAAIEGFFRAT